MEYIAVTNQEDDLRHYGVLGMKWGVRRYQDVNGRLTDAGRKHAADRTFTKSSKKEIRLKKTAQKAELKAAKYQLKATKKRVAAERWLSSMYENLSKISAEDISAEKKQKYKEYVATLSNDPKAQSYYEEDEEELEEW